MIERNARFDMPEGTDIAWCPGCGNHKLLEAVKGALKQLDIPLEQLVMVSGIGQAAKTPQYLKVNMFNGLHGRALPAAFGIRMANPNLTVVVESGDGDLYGEGGNHFIHAIRRNFNVTIVVHDNMVYGLTKGQASPTSQRCMKTSVQTGGVMAEPFNPLAVAIALDAPFVARAFAGNVEQTASIIIDAIRFKGCAVVDVFQPCVVFNRLNTWQWFREHTFDLPEGYDPANRMAALEMAFKQERYPLGILYRNDKREPFETLAALGEMPLFRQPPPNDEAFRAMLDTFR